MLDNFRVYYIVDETPPTVPAALTAEVLENDRVVLTWGPAEDSDGRVAGYKIYRDDVLVAQVGTETAYTDTAVEPLNGYYYQVSAVNAGGTEGEKSEKVLAYLGVSTVSPSVTGTVLNSAGQATLTFSKTMDKASAETAANYTLSGGAAVTAAQLEEDGKTVTLTLTGIKATGIYALHMDGVYDVSGISVRGSETVLLTNLIHYFKLDETEGTVAADFVGKSDGTKSATVNAADGMNGKAAHFARDGYIDVSGDGLFHQNEYTLSAWIKWEGTSNESQTIFSNGASGDASSYGIWFHVRTDKRLWVSFKNNNGGYTDLNSGNTFVPENEWVHVAFVKRADGSDLYLNGVRVATSDVAVDVGDHNSKMRIGGNYNGSNSLLHKFGGCIDEFRIYGCALTAEEVAEVKGENALPHVIGGQYSVEEGEDRPLTVKVDFAGSGLDGIVLNEALLDKGNYTVSVSDVTFSGEYMSSLQAGTYTFALIFDDMEATSDEITVQVKEKEEWLDLTPLLRAIYEAEQMRKEDHPGKDEEWTQNLYS